jgi:hypothetical protein
MRVADKQTGITRADLEAVGAHFGIKAARHLVQHAIDTVGDWPAYAQQAEVSAEVARRIEQELSARRAVLG